MITHKISKIKGGAPYLVFIQATGAELEVGGGQPPPPNFWRGGYILGTPLIFRPLWKQMDWHYYKIYNIYELMIIFLV